MNRPSLRLAGLCLVTLTTLTTLACTGTPDQDPGDSDTDASTGETSSDATTTTPTGSSSDGASDSSSSSGGDDGTTGDVDDSAQLQAALDAVVQSDQVTLGALGMGVTLELADGRVFHSAAGNIGPDADAPAYDTHAIKQVIGSTTKLYTAALIMQLVEEGAVDLDQTIDAWLAIPGADQITVRMLLRHTSGLNDCLKVMTEAQKALAWTPAELVQLAIDAGPWSEPGSELARYSNTNFVVLAMIVETVTGSSWQANLAARIAEPLGLKQTAYSGDPDGAAELVDGWVMTQSGWVGTLAQLDPSIGWGMGAIASTNEEMAVFLHALFAGDLFSSPDTLALMTDFVAPMDPQTLAPGEPPQTVGLGVIRFQVGDVALDGHLGHILGYHTALLRDPETGALITATTNTEGAIVGLTAVKIAQYLRAQ
jgi:D-alanyl-D-alanine carboxypeptidase